MKKSPIESCNSNQMIYGLQIFSNENDINYKVVVHIEVYRFYFGCFSIWGCLDNIKINFNIWEIQTKVSNCKWCQMEMSSFTKL
jgi:hypothetical protein